MNGRSRNANEKGRECRLTVERFQVCLGGRSGRPGATSSMYPSFRFFLATLKGRDPEDDPPAPCCGDVSSESDIDNVFGSARVDGILVVTSGSDGMP